MEFEKKVEEVDDDEAREERRVDSERSRWRARSFASIVAESSGREDGSAGVLEGSGARGRSVDDGGREDWRKISQ